MGHVEATKALLEKPGIRVLIEESRTGFIGHYTALHYAAARGHVEIVELLLARPDIQIDRGNNLQSIQTLKRNNYRKQCLKKCFFTKICVCIFSVLCLQWSRSQLATSRCVRLGPYCCRETAFETRRRYKE